MTINIKMSTTINTDRITTKHASSIILDTTSNISLKPYTQTLSAPVSMGTNLAVATLTGSITREGNICFLQLERLSFTSPASATAECPILYGTDFIPTASKYVYPLRLTNTGPRMALLEIDNSGLVTFYYGADKTVFSAGTAYVIAGQVYKYTI